LLETGKEGLKNLKEESGRGGEKISTSPKSSVQRTVSSKENTSTKPGRNLPPQGCSCNKKRKINPPTKKSCFCLFEEKTAMIRKLFGYQRGGGFGKSVPAGEGKLLCSFWRGRGGRKGGKERYDRQSLKRRNQPPSEKRKRKLYPTIPTKKKRGREKKWVGEKGQHQPMIRRGTACDKLFTK